MKLLVLGGSGFIGSEFVKRASLSNEVLATYNNTNFTKHNFSSIKFCFPNDFDILKKIIINEQPNVIINFIANTNLDYCENNQKNVYDLNVILPKKICKLSNEINSKFIHISSDYVFDGKQGDYNENDNTHPVNFYGYTKQLSEEITLKYSKNIVIRTSSVYDLKLQTNFIQFVFEKLKKNEKVFAFNDVLTTPILIDELTDSLLRIITSNESGIFHISGDECITRFEFAKIIAQKLKLHEELIVPISVKSIEQKISRPQNSCLNNKKIKEIFNIKFSKLEDNIGRLK
jgi:dTDP-4-dehydrorhamnose reductase